MCSCKDLQQLNVLILRAFFLNHLHPLATNDMKITMKISSSLCVQKLKEMVACS